MKLLLGVALFCAVSMSILEWFYLRRKYVVTLGPALYIKRGPTDNACCDNTYTCGEWITWNTGGD